MFAVNDLRSFEQGVRSYIDSSKMELWNMEDLYTEVQNGESTLTVDLVGHLVRNVSIVVVKYFCKAEQMYSVIEKILPNETPELAAVRAVKRFGIDTVTKKGELMEVGDSAYPGLETVYRRYIFTASLPD